MSPDKVSSAPAARFALSAAIFLRLLAIIHVIAFLSFWIQLDGLIGPHGLLPANGYLHAAREQLGPAAYAQLPTLCWLFGADHFLPVLCALGVAAAALLFAGIVPALCLALLWACYLSLVGVGQSFLSFQWDALLLETTFLAIFLAPWSLRPRWRPVEPPRLAHLLLVWLLFRLMLLSGIVKLSSGDPLWRQFTALTVHYETQPLPNPLAWWIHQLPAGAHRAACAGMFFIELLVPFFLFAPRSLRHNAALLLAALQVAIALTGNYAFFNLLTLALCLLCLDDDTWLRVVPRRLTAKCHIMDDILPDRGSVVVVASPSGPQGAEGSAAPAHPPLRAPRALGRLGAVSVVLYTALLAAPACDRSLRLPSWFYAVVERVAPFATFNNYGLFAVMTPTRPELIFEGSVDGRTWQPYEFPDKPGDLTRRPTFVAPHQPRLDWQLWFAALGPPEQNRWVLSLCEHLLRGSPDVLALLAHDPFPGRPPRFVRVVRYEYHFTTAAERARTGRWWRRTPLDYYVPPASLH